MIGSNDLSARSVSPASGGSGDDEKGKRSGTRKSAKGKHKKRHGRGKSGSSGSDSDTGKRRSKVSGGRKKAKSLYFREGDEGKIIRILEQKKERLRNIDVESVSQVKTLPNWQKISMKCARLRWTDRGMIFEKS